jgi:hypothetical protein
MKAYRNMLARTVSGLLLAGAFVVVSAARADAALIVYVCDDAVCSGGADFTITDNGAGDSDLGVGTIEIDIDGFLGSVSSNTKPFIGDPTTPALSLNYLLGPDAFTAIATPYIFATEDGFTAGDLATFQANATFQSGGTAALFSGAGSFDVTAIGAPLLSCLSVAAPGCLSQAPVGAGTPYYLALRAGPTVGPFGIAQADLSVTVESVPDGGSTAMLLGSMLVAFGAFRRKFTGR